MSPGRCFSAGPESPPRHPWRGGFLRIAGMFDKPTVWCYGSVIGKSKTRTQGEETMKKLGTRTYRGIILTPVLGGWTHKTSGHDATGAPFAYSAFTKSLEAARHAIKIEISSGRYEARDGILTKKGA